MSLNISDELGTRLDVIRDLRKKASRDPSRFRDYPYLSAVFDLCVFVRSNKLKRVAIDIIANDRGLTITPDTHLIRAIIDATCKVDGKTKSRWTRALRYAWRQRDHWQDMSKFIRRNGGISGCANWFTETRRRRRTRSGRPRKLPSDGQLRLMKRFTEQSRARLMDRIKHLPATVPTFIDRRLTVGELDRLQKESSNR